MCLKKVNQKETRFSQIAMCVNASETPFLISIMLCFYVLKIIAPNGYIDYKNNSLICSGGTFIHKK
jgi:cell division protein FtsB